MDYSKSGNPKGPKGNPHSKRGAMKGAPPPADQDKGTLLERMKAAAAAKAAKTEK